MTNRLDSRGQQGLWPCSATAWRTACRRSVGTGRGQATTPSAVSNRAWTLSSCRAGAAVWESSHVGGHRFAANLVVLPRGLHYGRLSPAQGPTAVREAAHGRVVPEVLRGRPGQAPPVQAAEVHARHLDGLTALDALSVTGYEETTPNGSWRWPVRPTATRCGCAPTPGHPGSSAAATRRPRPRPCGCPSSSSASPSSGRRPGRRRRTHR